MVHLAVNGILSAYLVEFLIRLALANAGEGADGSRSRGRAVLSIVPRDD